MRFSVALASLFVLVSCASGPAPSASSAATPAPRATSGLASMLASAGQSNAPTLTLIERTFGPADIRRQDGVGIALTYRMQTCALLLLFAPDTGNQMRLAVANPSAREPGAATPSMQQCADEARARRGS